MNGFIVLGVAFVVWPLLFAFIQTKLNEKAAQEWANRC
jgi:hypothetical protein|tara:strand:- start:87 stop:200 length:114 start_codon:yes stop_codon:yes gene_type:complete